MLAATLFFNSFRMKYNISIDQPRSIEWGLNHAEALMFSFCYALPSWADSIFIDGEVYYFASRTKVIEEMPIITDKADTVYRLYKSLKEKGLIDFQKFGKKDCIRLTEKSKSWNSEKNPSAGNISEKTRKKIRENSENFPTDNITIDNITNNTSISISENEKSEKIPVPDLIDLIEIEGDDVQTLNEQAENFQYFRKNDFLIKLANDYTVQEALTRRTGFNTQQIQTAATEFAEDQLAKEEFKYAKYQDFKRHFYNWMLQNHHRVLKNWQNGPNKPIPPNNGKREDTIEVNGIPVKRSTFELYQSESD